MLGCSWRVALVTLLIALPALDALAQAPLTARAVRGVKLALPEGSLDLDIAFFEPFRYRSHAPLAEGNLLQIRLVRVSRSALVERQVIPWTGSAAVPLIDLLYDDGPAGPTLTLRFSRSVRFAVIQANDLHQLRVGIDPEEPLAPPPPEPPGWRMERHASISQAHRTNLEGAVSEKPASTMAELSSELSLSTQATSEAWEVGTDLFATHRVEQRAGTHDLRLRRLSLEVRDRRRALFFKVGRLTGGSRGLPGLFDGGRSELRIASSLLLGLASGAPVEIDGSNVSQDQRHFYAAHVALETFAEGVCDAELFIVRQMDHGFQDRAALGGEFRCERESHSLKGIVDYDWSYDRFNTLLVVANLALAPTTTLNLLWERRASKLLVTRNALEGQTAENLDDLVATLGEHATRRLASDRTAREMTATLGVSRRPAEDLLMGLDLSVHTLSATPASGGVAATPGTGHEYTLTAHWTRTGWLLENDYAKLLLQYADGDTSNDASIELEARVPVRERLRVGPSLHLEVRDRESQPDELSVEHTLELDYHWASQGTLEASLGAEWIRRAGSRSRGDEMKYFVAFGYRYEF